MAKELALSIATSFFKESAIKRLESSKIDSKGLFVVECNGIKRALCGRLDSSWGRNLCVVFDIRWEDLCCSLDSIVGNKTSVDFFSEV